MTDDALISRLEAALRGLVWRQGDNAAPLSLVWWPSVTRDVAADPPLCAADLLPHANLPPQATVESVVPDDLFYAQIASAGAASVRFARLLALLQGATRDLTAYRAGDDGQIHVFILGETDNGGLMGFRTLAIEA